MKGFLIATALTLIITSFFVGETMAQEESIDDYPEDSVDGGAVEPPEPKDPDCSDQIRRGVRPKPSWVPRRLTDWGWAKNCKTGTELNFYFDFENRKLYFLDNDHGFKFPEKISVLRDRCTLKRLKKKGNLIRYRVRTNEKFDDSERLMTLYINALLKGALDVINLNRLERYLFHSER